MRNVRYRFQESPFREANGVPESRRAASQSDRIAAATNVMLSDRQSLRPVIELEADG